MKTEGLTSWVEVDLGALRHNLQQVRLVVGPKVRILAVVKADAYGHGAVPVARALAAAGVQYLGVTTLEEGLEIRRAGVSIPMLVFSPLLPDQIEEALINDLDITVFNLDMAAAVSECVARCGKRAMVHIKVDTGMGRLGVMPEECPSFLYSLLRMSGVDIAGVYTHFANAAAKNLFHANEQNKQFSQLVELLESKDMPTGLCHASGSAAILNLPDARYDMVRAGTILYGQYPGSHLAVRPELKETWTLKSRIVAVRKLSAGTGVGYGGEWSASRPTRAAIIAVGYSDGFTVMPESVARRMLSPIRVIAEKVLHKPSAPHVVVNGQRAPVIGRVSMQMCSIDVTDIPGAKVGDEVIIPARRTTTSSLIPRVYVE